MSKSNNRPVPRRFSAGQYRALVAHLNFWKMNLKDTLTDLELINKFSIDDALNCLFDAGWIYNQETGEINYIAGANEEKEEETQK